MAIFTAPFTAIAVSLAQDVWEILTPTNSRVAIREVRLGQYSDAGDVAAEILAVKFYVGVSSSGSGGSTITTTPNIHRHTGAPSAGSVVERNNTTQSSGGTLIWSEAWNIQAPFVWKPDPDERIILEANTRFAVTLTAPADEITLNGTLVFEEFGQGGTQ